MVESGTIAVDTSPLPAFDDGYQPEEGDEVEEVEEEEAFDDAIAAGVKAGASKLSANYMEKENISLLNAWGIISLDAITGSDQSGKNGIRNPWSGVERLWTTHSLPRPPPPVLSPFWISMANTSTVEAPPPKEVGSVDPSPDSNAASGIDLAEAEAAGAEAAEPIASDFILDTGAPVHATGDVRLISNARDLGPGEAVSMTRRDGKTLHATSVGIIRRGTIFSLDDVHCFPGLPSVSTLVSVPQLAQRGLSVMFCGPTCTVRDGSTEAVVGEGQLRDDDGFYHLDYLMVPIT
ncbi:hypothetical protein ACQ4PT_059901 [Festuca glaucescens]